VCQQGDQEVAASGAQSLGAEGGLGVTLMTIPSFRLDRFLIMGVWQGVALDSLKFHPSLPCHTQQRPAGGPPLKRPYVCFRGGLRLSSTPLDTPRRTSMVFFTFKSSSLFSSPEREQRDGNNGMKSSPKPKANWGT
jgi:hypothetical protein